VPLIDGSLERDAAGTHRAAARAFIDFANGVVPLLLCMHSSQFCNGTLTSVIDTILNTHRVIRSVPSESSEACADSEQPVAAAAAAASETAKASAITDINKQGSAPVCRRCPSDPFLSALLVHHAMLSQSAHAAMWRLQQQLKETSAVLQPLAADFGPAGDTRENILHQIEAAARRSCEMQEALCLWDEQEYQRQREAERARQEQERLAEQRRQYEHEHEIVKCQRQGCKWSGMRKAAKSPCMVPHEEPFYTWCSRTYKGRHCRQRCPQCETICNRCHAKCQPFTDNPRRNNAFSSAYCHLASHEITG
jgi:hypothetical protein